MPITRSAFLMTVLMASAAAVPGAAQGPPAASPGGRTASLNEAWQQTLQGFDDWSHVQQIYTPQQVEEMRRKMVDRAASLSTAESERFRGDINAKLHVLFSAEARDARKWLAETLAVASDSYARKVRAQLPDVVHESAAQLQADLDAFEAREANVKQYQQGLQQTRQMAIKAIEEENRRQAEANAEAHVGTNYNPAPGGTARGGPGGYGGYYSPYRPPMPIGGGFRFW